MAIEIEDVRAAVQALRAAGEAITVTAVRGKLGRGSNSTIAPLLRVVRDAEDTGSEDGVLFMDAERAPAEVMDRIVAAARKAGEEAFRAIADPLELRIATANANLARERQNIRSDMDQVLADARDARDRALALEAELRQARDQIAAAEGARQRAQDELKSDQLRRTIEVDALNRQLLSTQGDLKTAQTRIESLLSEAGELRGKLAASTKGDEA